MLGELLLGVCLSLPSAPAPEAEVFVPVREFTLAWVHSIEKIRWEEDYRVAVLAGSALLVPKEARIRGTGAGMEPPPHATLDRRGWYHYQPATAPMAQLVLTRSGFVPDYQWCTRAGCLPLRHLIPSDGWQTLIQACLRPPKPQK